MKTRDEITDLLNSHLVHCDLCPRRCGVNRLNDEKGVCGAGSKPIIYQHFLHLGEEISIVPAFVINFAHCNLNCPDCPERRRWQDPGLNTGNPVHYAHALAHYLDTHEMPESIEWIGGEPSLEIRYVIETSWELKDILPDCPPIYLNTNGYFNPALFDCMKGAIDGFVFDLKACADCAPNLCGARDYWPFVTGNIFKAIDDFGAQMVIIRHLVVPGHVRCCTIPVIDWCRKYAPQATFNLMTTYRSFGENKSECNSLPPEEAAIAREYAIDAGFESLLVNGDYI